ncbi:hypothetical protein [Tritonibacter mobilis]|uniref:hypothetical protein n=1 Tax=Tritonibacter mobilis TaxID=379347 RepID=UPI001CD9DD81|nr:hypothetical protein [Tritonibacter mobilis]MCA2008027.1 hypothetical protein [Tritonibacter mobilis]
MKYLITTYDRNDVTDHANYCEAHQIPCIYALVRGKKCTVFVHCDKLTAPKIQALKAHKAEFMEFLARLSTPHAEPARIDANPPISFWYYDLPASAAEDVAEETYEFLRTILAPFDDT